jgi:hypothetical protein
MLTNELEKMILDADGYPISNMTESELLANDLRNSNLNGESDGTKLITIE